MTNFQIIPEIHEQFQKQNDNIPGFIYFLEAIGYHGWFPGCYLRRCKIGVSRNPEARLERFHQNQPPCDLRIIRTIFVNDMAGVEARLHAQFTLSNVKLLRSREWFDLNPFQFWLVQKAFNRYAAEYAGRTMILPMGTIMVGGAIALISFALVTTNNPSIPQLSPTVSTTSKPNPTVRSHVRKPTTVGRSY